MARGAGTAAEPPVERRERVEEPRSHACTCGRRMDPQCPLHGLEALCDCGHLHKQHVVRTPSAEFCALCPCAQFYSAADPQD